MIGRRDIIHDPEAVCRAVRTTLPPGSTLTVATHNRALTVLEAAIVPPVEFAAHGFPTEIVRISLIAGTEAPIAVPVGPRRDWCHRYLDLDNGGLYGQLCLWYPTDPPHLRWTWDNGFESFVHLVLRHLIFEEHCRRNGTWPGHEAPHGHQADGSPHPVPPELAA